MGPVTEGKTMLEGPERLLTTGATLLGGPERLFTTRAIVLEGPGRGTNMRISAEGARDCDNRNNSISGANEAVPTGATGLGAKRLLEGSTGGGMKAAYNRRNRAEVAEKLLATGTA